MFNETLDHKGLLGRAKELENLLIGRATHGAASDLRYQELRLEFIKDANTKLLLPEFVKNCRDLDSFWTFIKGQSGHYEPRRIIIRDGFTPLFEYLESPYRTPGDSVISDSLQNFDAESVHSIWSKALERRHADPEGAITVARTLLETICKHLLDKFDIPYNNKEDLPKLYYMAAKSLNLAPDQHIEEPIKAILGGGMTLVNGLGTLRNRFSDAHGSARRPVKPSPRHAALAVNTAGAMATFLVETFIETNKLRN